MAANPAAHRTTKRAGAGASRRTPGHAGGPLGARGRGRPRADGYDEAILQATLQLLQEVGYAGLTMDAVAAKARVGSPAVYRRWPSKPALVLAALARWGGLSPVPDTGRLREDLVATQRDLIEQINSPTMRRTLAGLIADLDRYPRVAAAFREEVVAPRRESLRQAVRRAVARGELRADTDAALVANLLSGTLVYPALVLGERLDPGLAGASVDVILAAFAPARSTRRRLLSGGRKK